MTVFAGAREAALKAVAPAGEESSPDYVEESLDLLRVK